MKNKVLRKIQHSRRHVRLRSVPRKLGLTVEYITGLYGRGYTYNPEKMGHQEAQRRLRQWEEQAKKIKTVHGRKRYYGHA